MNLIEINNRYSSLAEGDCCLSCGNALLHAEPQPAEICIDLGSGRGTDVIRMAEKVGHEGFVYGIDIAEGMLNKARQNAIKMGIKNVEFIKTDLEKINLPDSMADLVISNCTINHASDKLKVWQEIYRIMKPGGRFIISDIYSTAVVPDQYKNDPVAVSECWGGAETKGKYLVTLGEAGFKKITILEESTPYKKGEIEICSFTIAGNKTAGCCCNQ